MRWWRTPDGRRPGAAVAPATATLAGVQRNRPLKRHERILGGVAAAVLCGACADRLAIDLARLGLGSGLRDTASLVGLVALVVALPYALSQTLATVHFAAALLVVTMFVFAADAVLG